MSARFLAIVGVGLLLEAWARHRALRVDRWRSRVYAAELRGKAAEYGLPPAPAPFSRGR